jgi:hypothetical protein
LEAGQLYTLVIGQTRVRLEQTSGGRVELGFIELCPLALGIPMMTHGPTIWQHRADELERSLLARPEEQVKPQDT